MTPAAILDGICVIVPAAGRGDRMGDSKPKQYRELNGKPMLQHVLEMLLALGPKQLVVPIAPNDTAFDALPASAGCRAVEGAGSRSGSVRNGLAALHIGDDDWVMVHDAARPCVAANDIARLIEDVGDDSVGGILAVPVVETVKRSEDGVRIDATVARDGLWLAQTPQLFRYGLLARALASATNEGLEVTDEASAIEWLGFSPRLVEGSRENIKVTTPDDVALAEYFLRCRESTCG